MDATETQTLANEVENLENAIKEEITSGNKPNLRILREALVAKISEIDDAIKVAEEDDFLGHSDSDDNGDSDDIGAIVDDAVNTIGTIKGAIRKLVKERQAFTAWNVTCIARDNGIQGYHSTFRDLVHDAFESGEMGDYERDQIVPPGTSAVAWLYFPPGFDQSEYDGEPTVSTIDDVEDEDDSDASADVSSDSDGEHCSKSCDGVIYLPKKATNQVVLTDPVAFVFNKNAIFVTQDGSKPPTYHGAEVPLKIDNKGNVRISKTKFQELVANGLSSAFLTAKNFVANVDDNGVTVKIA